MFVHDRMQSRPFVALAKARIEDRTKVYVIKPDVTGGISSCRFPSKKSNDLRGLMCLSEWTMRDARLFWGLYSVIYLSRHQTADKNS